MISDQFGILRFCRLPERVAIKIRHTGILAEERSKDDATGNRRIAVCERR